MTGYREAMEVALGAACQSPDPSTQNGVALITPDAGLILACNDFPRGVAHSSERWERPLKYKFVEHAERSGIYKAASVGRQTQGATLVAVWAACSDCARAIVCAGIHRLVRLPADNDATASHWSEDIEIGDMIMREGGVEIIEFTDTAQLRIPPLRRNGQIWSPATILAS